MNNVVFIENQSKAEEIFKILYISVICIILSITLNSALIYKLIWKMRHSYLRGTLIIKLIISLSIMNIISAALNSSVLLSSVLASKWRFTQHSCNLHASAIEFDSLFSTILVMIICIERYLACNQRSNSTSHNIFTKSSTCGIIIIIIVSLIPIFTIETIQVFVMKTAYPVRNLFTCSYGGSTLQYSILAIGLISPYLVSLCALLRTLMFVTSRWCRSKATSWYVLSLLIAMPIINLPYLVVRYLNESMNNRGYLVAVLMRFSHPIVLPVFTMVWRIYHIKNFKLNRAKIREDCSKIEGLTLYASQNGLKLADKGYGIYKFANSNTTSEICEEQSISSIAKGNKDYRNGHNRIHNNNENMQRNGKRRKINILNKGRLKKIRKNKNLKIDSLKLKEIKDKSSEESSGPLTQTTSLNTLSESNTDILTEIIFSQSSEKDTKFEHNTPVLEEGISTVLPIHLNRRSMSLPNAS